MNETMEYGDFEEQIVIAVNNPYQLKIRPEKQIPFVKMAADGSLNDCGFHRDCGNWITKWIDEKHY